MDKIESVKDKRYQKFIETQLDSGESSAIALAAEKKDSLLIIDDLKARKFARRLGLRYSGTLGIINKAKEIIDELKTTNFRIAESVIDKLLKRNNE